MRYPAMDLLPGDIMNYPDDDGNERLVVLGKRLGSAERPGRRVIRFMGTYGDASGVVEITESASVDVRFERDHSLSS